MRCLFTLHFFFWFIFINSEQKSHDTNLMQCTVNSNLHLDRWRKTHTANNNSNNWYPFTYRHDSFLIWGTFAVDSIDIGFDLLDPPHTVCFADTDSSPPSSVIVEKILCILRTLSRHNVRPMIYRRTLCMGLFLFELFHRKEKKKIMQNVGVSKKYKS